MSSSAVTSSSESRGLGHSLLDSLAVQSFLAMDSFHLFVDFFALGIVALARRSHAVVLMSVEVGMTAMSLSPLDKKNGRNTMPTKIFPTK